MSHCSFMVAGWSLREKGNRKWGQPWRWELPHHRCLHQNQQWLQLRGAQPRAALRKGGSVCSCYCFSSYGICQTTWGILIGSSEHSAPAAVHCQLANCNGIRNSRNGNLCCQWPNDGHEFRGPRNFSAVICNTIAVVTVLLYLTAHEKVFVKKHHLICKNIK